MVFRIAVCAPSSKFRAGGRIILLSCEAFFLSSLALIAPSLAFPAAVMANSFNLAISMLVSLTN